MLALVTVGSFVLVLAGAAGEHFNEVVTAFGTLTGAMIGFYFGTRASQKKEDFAQPPAGIECPIPGCDHVFIGGRAGWESHVGPHHNHDQWHGDVTDTAERKKLFKDEFKWWFK